MEDRISIIKLLGLPETFAVLLLTFSFVLSLAPYFSGADFGLFKIPLFTELARKRLKIIGPAILLILVLLFVPIIARQSPTSSSNTNQHDTNSKQTNSNNELAGNDSKHTNPGTYITAKESLVPIHNQALQHIKRAQILYKRTQYQAALKECDQALRSEPGNQDALNLKNRIIKTLEILNRNQ